MPSRNSLLLALLLTTAAHAGSFAIIGTQPGPWPAMLTAVGHLPAPFASANIFVARSGAPASADWTAKVKAGAALILEGPSPLAASFGFGSSAGTLSVIHLVDSHNAALPVIWSKAVEIQTP